MFRMKSLVAAFVIVVLIFNLPVFSVYAQAADNTMINNFVDIDPQDPNLAFINYLSDREIIKGFSNGTYKPDGYLTRAQAAATMVRALGIPTQVPAETKFTDVPVSHWAHKVIVAVEREGLLKGFPDGTFRPNDRMTKSQAIDLILKLSGEPLPEVTIPLSDGFFTRSDMAKALAIAMTLSPATCNLPLTGELSATKGVIMVKKANETKFQTVAINKKIIINPGDSIKTDTDSLAEIVFEDGSGLLLESNLQMTINETQGLAYIGKRGKPGNTVNWLNIDLQKGKLFVFLASIMSVEEIEIDKEIPWRKGEQQDAVRVQIKMPLGTGTMKHGIGLFDASSYNSNVICNFIGQMNVTAQKQNIELKPAQIVSIFPDIKVLKADDIREKDLREFVSEKIKTFLLMRSDRAITNQALEMFYKKGVKTPPVKQRENLLEALHKAEKANTSPSIGGGGGGGGGNNGADSGSDTLMKVSKVTAVPDSRAVTAGTEVSLNTETVGANIYYTLDESTPTTSSTQYTHPIIINANTTIKAIAVKGGMINSAVEIFNYTIQGAIELSGDATLSNLTLSAGSLTPVFNPSITNYTINVANVVTSTTVTATANSAKASIDIGGTHVVDLKVGENQVTISVTAEDKTIKIYTIRIIRDVAQVDPPDLENSWIVVGERGFSEGEASLSSLYIANGIPYIAYKDKANGDRLTVKKYDGSTWLDVGEQGFTRGGVHTNSLLIDNGTPYIGYVDNYWNQRITVKKYFANQWMNVGDEGMTSSSSYDVSICLNLGILYAAYSDGGRSGRATVKKFENESWQDVGASGFSPKEAYFISLSVNNGVPYIAFQDEWRGPVEVMKYNGSDWVNVGSPKLGTETAYGITLEIFNGIPYVAYQDGDKGPLIVKKFNEGSGDWVNVTQLNFSEDTYVYGPSFKFVSPDSVYVAYRDGVRGERATVQHYNGTSWIVVGDTGFTPYRILDLSIDVHENTPYVSFRESYDGITNNPLEGRVSVMKYGVAESSAKTATPIITSLPVKSGDMDIEGTAEPNSLIMMKRGNDTWDTMAQGDGSFVVSINGDYKRLGAFDEVLITAQVPGKLIS